MPERPIRIVILNGSVRPGNNTLKAVRLVLDELARDEQVGTQLIDPAELDLPLPGRPMTPDVAEIQAAVAGATGVIIATPEYHGSYSSTIKLVIDNLGYPSKLGGKPLALLGVAAGAIGAIKATEHLRSVCSHVGALVLPSITSVAGVGKVFDAEGHCLDEAVERRIRGVAHVMLDYIHGYICPKVALESVVRGDA